PTFYVMSAQELGRLVANVESGKVLDPVDWQQMKDQGLGFGHPYGGPHPDNKHRAPGVHAGPNNNKDASKAGKFNLPDGCGGTTICTIFPGSVIGVILRNSKDSEEPDLKFLLQRAYDAAWP